MKWKGMTMLNRST